jgi:adenine-specific DNA methylase
LYASANVVGASATHALSHDVDIIVTDPPYYDAIPYAVM